jgi:hypothetical protein
LTPIGQGRLTATYDVLHFAGSAHEHLVRDRVGSKQLFVQLVEHIRSHGYEANFYARKTTYFDIEEFGCRRFI